MKTENQKDYLELHKQKEDNYLDHTIFLLSSKRLQRILNEYQERHQDKTDLGINAFALASDLYYRENFHSDIICEFLNPKGSHNQGDKYLKIFLDMLSLNKLDFCEAEVSKEETTDGNRRIDILIKDTISKQAIIIENKMNNAGDMYRQLPDYYHFVSSQGYNIVAIVYIPLYNNKIPDKNGWTDNESKLIDHVIQIIPAYCSGNKLNLHDNWLTPSILHSNDIDCMMVLRQYAKLIKHLNIEAMDEITLEKFYKYLQIDDNYNSYLTFQNLLAELPEYMAIRIYNKYLNNYKPFNKVSLKNCCGVLFEEYTFSNNKSYKFDIWCSTSGYQLVFYRIGDFTENIKETFTCSEVLKLFTHKDNNLYIIFTNLNFNEEDRLIKIIDDLLVELKELKEKCKNG